MLVAVCLSIVTTYWVIFSIDVHFTAAGGEDANNNAFGTSRLRVYLQRVFFALRDLSTHALWSLWFLLSSETGVISASVSHSTVLVGVASSWSYMDKEQADSLSLVCVQWVCCRTTNMSYWLNVHAKIYLQMKFEIWKGLSGGKMSMGLHCNCGVNSKMHAKLCVHTCMLARCICM